MSRDFRSALLVLASFALFSCRSEGRDPVALTEQKLRVIAALLDDELKVSSRYPRDLEELKTIVRQRSSDAEKLLQDDWGHPIRYTAASQNLPPIVYSVGEDGKDDQGTGDDIAYRIEQ